MNEERARRVQRILSSASSAALTSINVIRSSKTRRSRYSQKRTVQLRDFYGAWRGVRRDFLSKNATIHLRTCFRIDYRLFTKLMTDLPSFDPFWKWRTNAVHRAGIYPAMKILAALKILAEGATCNSVVREFTMCASTVQSCVENFASAIVHLYKEEHLSSYLTDFDKFETSYNRTSVKHRLPGLAGSIDCVHVYWHMCPHAEQGSFKGRYKHPTLVSEAICDSDLRFTHLYSSQPGVLNDLNVLQSSPFTQLLYQKRIPNVTYSVAGQDFKHPFFLGDGIYPRWPVFLTAPRNPSTAGQKRFTKRQESVRKDIERAFGVLKCRFRILKHGLFYRNLKKCDDCIQACFILHNLILESRLGIDPVQDLRKDNILREDEELEDFLSMEEDSVNEDEVMLPEVEVNKRSLEEEFWYFNSTEHERLREAYYKVKFL